MQPKQQRVSAGISFAVVLVLASAIALEKGFVDNSKWYYVLWLTIPLLGLCLYTGRNKML
jgi:hypothetical protein